MSNSENIIQKIKIGETQYSLDSIKLDGKTSDEYQEDNLVTSISSKSTSSQYPSAKCVWGVVGDLNSLKPVSMIFNSVLDNSTLSVNETFTSNNQEFTSLTKTSTTMNYDSTKVYDNGTWTNQNYKKIRLNSSTNTELISFIESNGKEIEKYTVTVTSNGHGTVSGAGTYEQGSVITLTASPYSGYEFKEWSDKSINNPKQITVNSDISLSCTFEEIVPNDEVWYTTESGNVLNIDQYGPVIQYATGGVYNGPAVLSNTYSNGKGVIKFASALTKIGMWKNGDTVNYCLPLFVNTDYGLTHDLTSISLPNSITSIETLDLGRGNDDVIPPFYSCNKLKNIKLSNSLQSIPNAMCDSCSSLISVIIPNSVTTIEYGCFYHCTSLTSVTISDSVTSIEEGSFNGCSSLSTITIPNSVTSIGISTFNNCINLDEVICNSIIPPTLGHDAFYNNKIGRKIKVPAESLQAYKTATDWSIYRDDIISQ